MLKDLQKIEMVLFKNVSDKMGITQTKKRTHIKKIHNKKKIVSRKEVHINNKRRFTFLNIYKK